MCAWNTAAGRCTVAIFIWNKLGKSLREAFHPLMSEQPTHSTRPAADLAVVQQGLWRAFTPTNVATYVG